LQLHLRSIATDMPIRPTVHRELPASFYKLLLNPRSRDLPSRPRIYQYAHKYPSSQNGDTLNWPYPPFRLGSIPGSLYLSGYERVFMKKRRLGEELRERGHLSTADLNQVLLEQRGKRVHLGELLLQGGKVAKTDLDRSQ